MKTKLDLLKVWDTPKAWVELRNWRKIASQYGPLDHITLVGVDLPDLDGPPTWFLMPPDAGEFSILLNGADRYFGAWPANRRLSRLMWLLEVYFRTLECLRDKEAGLPPNIAYTDSAAPEAGIASIIRSTRATYTIYREIDTALREHLITPNGPMTLGFLQAEAMSPPLLGELLTQLDSMPPVLDKLVARGRSGHPGEDTEAWLGVSAQIHNLLSSLAQLAAGVDMSNDWQWIQSRLYDNATFARFFGEGWPVMHADWRSALAAGQRDKRQPTEETIKSLKEVFRAIGIIVLEKPIGMKAFEFVATVPHG